jgi:hypothetical protein
VWLAPFVFIIFVIFCHQVVHLIHLVFRWTQESNSHPRTMAQTVSPQCSPLDQGASINVWLFSVCGSWTSSTCLLLISSVIKPICYTLLVGKLQCVKKDGSAVLGSNQYLVTAQVATNTGHIKMVKFDSKITIELFESSFCLHTLLLYRTNHVFFERKCILPKTVN